MAIEEGELVRVYFFQNNWVSWCQKGKTSLDVNEARVQGWVFAMAKTIFAGTVEKNR